MFFRSINSAKPSQASPLEDEKKQIVPDENPLHHTTSLFEDFCKSIEICQPHIPSHEITEVATPPGFVCIKSHSAMCEVSSNPSLELKMDNTLEPHPANLSQVAQTNPIQIPSELWESIGKAAKQGFLYSFLLTLTEEFISKELKGRGYQEHDIYLINQFIRALTLIAAGHSLIRVIATPVANYFLLNIVGMNETNANAVTLGTVIAIDCVTNPLGILGTVGIFGTGIAFSLAGSKIAKKTSHFLFDDSCNSEIEMVPLGASRIKGINS